MKYYPNPSFLIVIALISINSLNIKANDIDNRNLQLVETANKKIHEHFTQNFDTTIDVKVIYFHGSDFTPDPYYKERLTRTLNDVSNFYKEEFNRYGLDIEGIPFEKEGDAIKIYTVKGNSPSLKYKTNDQLNIIKEIYNKIGNQFDSEINYMLVINALYYKRVDSSYVFHSPYFGLSFEKGGICMVADCDLLDAKLLTDTIHRMTFSEMMVQNKECHVAEFNSWYIGGIAHELGHVFGMPHNYGNPEELNDTCIALMGQHGSRHFRDYQWNGKKSSFISLASMYYLIGHPLFSLHSDLNIKDSGFQLKDISFDWKNDSLIMTTNFKTGLAPYAAVALVRPTSASEYYNNSFSSLVLNNNTLDINLTNFPKDKYILTYHFLFADGSKKEYIKYFEVDENKKVQLIDKSKADIVDLDVLYSKLIQKEKTSSRNVQLEILKDILNPIDPIDPANYKVNKLYLSDAQWINAKVGWGEIARNYFSLDREATLFLVLSNKIYKKGLYAHSPSVYSFNTNGTWNKFTATVGLRDYAHSQGSARFSVIGDGKVLFKSKALRVNQVEKIDIDISNVNTLELRADPTEGHNHNSWAVWADPLIYK